MLCIYRGLAATAVAVAAVVAAAAPASAAHRLLIQGNNTLAIVAVDGDIEWEMPWGAIHDVHNVRVRNTDAGEIVNFHCRAAPSMSVIKVHQNVDEIERALRRAFPTVKRVISHAEPPHAR